MQCTWSIILCKTFSQNALTEAKVFLPYSYDDIIINVLCKHLINNNNNNNKNLLQGKKNYGNKILGSFDESVGYISR